MHFSSRHRLSIAVPLLCTILAVGFSGSSTKASLSADSVQQGTVMQQEEGTLVDETVFPARLSAGTVTIASRSLWTVKVGGLRLVGFHGAARIQVQSGPISIVALTTPVLIEAEGHSALVPAGMQLSVTSEDFSADDATWDTWFATRKPLLVPATFLKEQLPAALALMEQSVVPPLSESPSAVLFSIMQFDAASKRAEHAQTVSLLATLSKTLHEGSMDEFDTLMESEETSAALRSIAARAFLPDLFSLAIDRQRQNILLPFFAGTEERWLLARFHPLLKQRAWLLTDSAIPLSDDHRRILLALLPFSDRSTEALPPSALQIWQSMLGHEEDTDLLPILLQSVHSLADAYPERTAQYAEAILPLCAVTTEHDDTCDAMRRLIKEPMTITLPPAASSSAAASPSSVAPLDADALHALEAKAAELVSLSGFMTTPQTTFTAGQDGFVQINSIVLGTSKGDQLQNLRFDPVHDRIITFGTDGKPAPFALTLQAYLEWMKGE